LLALPVLFSKAGVPKLSLAMHPFSISKDEHVPLNIGTGRIFFKEGPVVDFPVVGQKYFCRGAKSGKITFYHWKARKQPFLQKYLMGKCQTSESWEGLGPPSDAHTPKTSDDKKADLGR